MNNDASRKPATPDAIGTNGCAVAITGMACLFPGAANLATYWSNIRGGVDAITEVPAHRWDPVYYDPDSDAPDRFYCRRGGFVDDLADFDPLAYGIMPVAADGAEPDQLISLRVGAEALADAGLTEKDFDPRRAGVIIGRGNYIGAGMTRLEQHVRTSEQLVGALRQLVPNLSDSALRQIKTEFQGKLGHYGPDTAIGLVPNLTASRLANRLNLFGPAYTVDGACASSLLAVDQAVRELRSGRCDFMLAGGIHLSHDVAFWSVFCQLGALSRRQRIRPFDRRADGLLIGEGAGMVCLKRLEDAARDGDRIYAVIRGCGISSDGRAAGLMNPAVSGQLMALERAWSEAGLDPEELGYLEAHGTGTPAGDEAELTTLARFFGSATHEEDRIGIGSVKSMIGHTMPAAGIAGLIKAALAIHHAELPPTLHCEQPHDIFDRTRFAPIDRARVWPTDPRGSRIAAVNAFGFGGINAHVVLEGIGIPAPRKVAHDSDAQASATTTVEAISKPVPPAIAIFAADTPEALARDLETNRQAEPDPKTLLRLAILDPTPERRKRAGIIASRGRAWRGREGIYFSPDGLLSRGGKLAFLYPGVDSSFEPRLDDLAAFFGMAVPSQAHPVALSPEQLESAGMGIIQTNRLLTEVLERLNIGPDALAGHSIGEWSAMIAADCLPRDQLDAFIDQLKPGTLEVPGVVFLAAGCGLEKAQQAIANLADIVISHENCTRQVIICGCEASIAAAERRLRTMRVLAQRLPFQSGFHSPLFTDYLGPHQNFFKAFPLQPASLPLWSATLAAPYPTDVDAIRELAVRHLVEPVRFRPLVEKMHDAGFRVFVQVGTGSLPGFVDDSLGRHPHLAISANLPKRSGLVQLCHLAAALWCEGALVDLAVLGSAQATSETSRAKPARTSATRKLALGVPLVRLDTRLDLNPAESKTERKTVPPTGERATHPVAQGFQTILRELETASADILEAWRSTPPARRTNPASRQATPPPPPDSPTPSAPSGRSNEAVELPTDTTPRERGPVIDLTETRTTHRRLSVQACPELLDHSFFAQPPNWPIIADRYPVVPMTMSIQILLEAARQAAPGKVVVALEKLQAFRWLVVTDPVDLEIRTKRLGHDRLAISLEGYARAETVLADRYPEAPTVETKTLPDETPTSIDAETLYRERWMFHGPAYQGIETFHGICDGGIRGRLVARQGPGSLLDNAGQLFGYWIMARATVDRLAMPIGLRRILFYGPDPTVGQRLDCTVHIREVTAKEAAADMELNRDGRVWARIEDWRDRRFDTDRRMWPVILRAEAHLLAVPHPERSLVLFDRYRSAPSRDYLARRFLTQVERDAYDRLPPRGKRQWLNGRIAAKDAVRHDLMQGGRTSVFPAELRVTGPAEGMVRVESPYGNHQVAVAAQGDVAIARLTEHDLGLAILPLTPDGDPVDLPAAETFLAESERGLLPREDDALALARFWAAKCAFAHLWGEARGSNPHDCAITAVEPARLRVENRDRGARWIASWDSRSTSRDASPQSTKHHQDRIAMPSHVGGAEQTDEQVPGQDQESGLDFMMSWTVKR
ncbi:Polyketide synthase dehydratase domain-containing protein [Sulfidibacter corallicola]|uniref:Polyketide synthase dehydratase domain-containing protein n=1 Tax=Sulfidibacter corallicola TaxID=2818388 RepID=A0A8A4TEL4_SULCO|nr:type I polyketide synthase [Sulfidibacter corallicola]QTD47987.1 polyketide synthase dehydratase domain-containing protein [Sulfidibacter corallicola]